MKSTQGRKKPKEFAKALSDPFFKPRTVKMKTIYTRKSAKPAKFFEGEAIPLDLSGIRSLGSFCHF